MVKRGHAGDVPGTRVRPAPGVGQEFREGYMESTFLSSSARQSIGSLKRFDALFRATSERLATGLKVNRASDNPTAFFTARALNDRAGDLNRLVDSVGTKLGAIQTAEVGIKALERLVNVAEAVVAAAAAVPAPRPTATGSVDVSSQTNVTDLAGVSGGDQFSVQVGASAAVTVTVSSSDTPDDLLAKINAVDNVQASFTATGELQIETTNGQDLTLAEVTNTPLAGLGLTAGTFDASSSTSEGRAALATEFDGVLTQINQLAADSSFLGVNLLAGDSPVLQFNASGTSSLRLTGANADAAGLGISTAANGFQTDADIAAARSDVQGGLSALRGVSAQLATELSVVKTRTDFAKGLRNILRSGADRLTLSDPNEEGANLLALQTRTGLASASFAITQRAESNILRLFN